PPRPALLGAFEAIGSGPALPGPALPGRRRDSPPAERVVHRVVVGGTGVRAGERHAGRHRQGSPGAGGLAAKVDRSRAVRLVLERSPHPRRGLPALSGSHARRAARRHDAADPRRVAERGLGADVGSLLLPPEAVLHGPRRPAVAPGPAHALRPRGVGLSLQPRGPPGAPGTEGPGL